MSEIQNKINTLIENREKARMGGGQETDRRTARQGQVHGPRAYPDAARRGIVRRVRHVRHAPLLRLRHGQEPYLRRRRGDGLRHDRRPSGLRLRTGLHGDGRFAVAVDVGQDLQGHGHGHAQRRALHRLERFGRRPNPGGNQRAGRLCQHLPAQRDGIRHHPSFGHLRPLRGRCGLFAGTDRLHDHEEGDLGHAPHRPEGRQDRHRRRRHAGAVGRRHDAHDQVGRGAVRRRHRGRGHRNDQETALLHAAEQHGGCSARRLHRPRRLGWKTRSTRPSSPTTPTSPTTWPRSSRPSSTTANTSNRRRATRRTSSPASPVSTASRWASSPTSRSSWPACWTSTPAARRRGSCVSATPSTFRWSRW